MCIVFRSCIRGAAAAVLLAAGGLAAQAATITHGGALSDGISADLSGHVSCGSSGALVTNVGTFTGKGVAGSGRSVCGDTSSVQVKDLDFAAPYGRYNPEGSKWIDSNDLKKLTWEVDIGMPFRALSFGVVDAHDQKDSFFEIALKGGAAHWSIDQREGNGLLHWITVTFHDAVDGATLAFSTRHNDGYGLVGIKVAPVPLPAASWLLVSGALALAGLRRRRTSPIEPPEAPDPERMEPWQRRTRLR
jgi:hypothetical protein